MIAVSTTCMAEVIGDDLQLLHPDGASEKGSVPQDFDVPFAHTPAFVGSHVDGYDNMHEGHPRALLEGRGAHRRTTASTSSPASTASAVGNNRELKRMLDADGRRIHASCRTCPTSTTRRPTASSACMTAAPRWTRSRPRSNAKATISMQEYCTPQDAGLLRRAGPGDRRASTIRWASAATDELLMKLSELTGKDDPGSAAAGARPPDRRHGRQPGLSARQDLRDLRRSGFRLRAWRASSWRPAASRRHCLATNGSKDWEEQMKALLASSPFGKGCQVWAGQGPVAHALAAGDRAGRLPDRHLLRQVPASATPACR